MNENKDKAISLVLKEEGGFTNDPRDPGGATNFGITIFDARKYLDPDADVEFMRNMTVDQAIGIYGPKYWDKVRGDEIPAGLDYTLMDYGVNSGVSRAIKVLQRVLEVDDDGAFGDGTMAALKAADARDLIIQINDERLRFLQSLRTWSHFGKGWGARVARVKKISLEMFDG